MQKDQPYYLGNRALRDAGFRSRVDTPLGARFRAAGLITVGKTNLPEFGLQSTTQPLAFGATHNPWALDRSTSGSSGGSCAALAAGLVPIAHANDGGGSIRLPAAWCGLVGLKPSRGRISDPAGYAGLERTGCQPHCPRRRGRARRRSRLRAGRSFVALPPVRSYRAEVGADPGKLRIGMLTRASFGDIHPECLTATQAAAQLLGSHGHEVEESYLEALLDPELPARMLPLGRLVFAAMLRGLSEALGRPATRDDVEPYTWSATELPSATANEYFADGMADEVEEASCALVVYALRSATHPDYLEPPVTLESMTPPDSKPLELKAKIDRQVFFTIHYNVTGQPAISLPLHRTPAGLPVRIQLVGAIGQKDLLIRVASQLEQARPWINRRPLVHA